MVYVFIVYYFVPGITNEYFYRVAFYSHAKSTCMAASFQQEGKFGPIKLV